ncbi:ScbR family autoregulator-binding transcription factor [Streptomyces barkulensis]|uniref:ScbR family autoregulator-binding transcription factor n=1 Tax=Streptomyces barkulensis TaxID=1257026 RepID=UPI001F109635|nr:ScbR family autoregulator-binding transcription factor [Streptomyces barkulensis]
MARQDRALRTRRAILEAAASVFEEKGYDAAKLTEILERAQVTKGALYFHFASKEELAQAVLDAQTREGTVSLAQPSKTQEFVDLGMVFAYRLTTDPLLRGSIRLALDQGAGHVPYRSRPYQEWMDICVGTLREARVNGELLSHVDPVESGELFVGAYTGINLVAQILGRRDSLENSAASLYRHLMPSITLPAVLSTLDLRPERGRDVWRQANGMVTSGI